ncbi:cysteine-rich CWC family protein [Amphritea japonica]|uniref:cysteine-rich CWC family protein n=1 Tax=Amphritea japonica TaxID=452627 RepID=UPI0019169703
MNTTPNTIDPNLCPICQQDNRCGNIASCGADESCWCSEITFPEGVLNQVPDEAKGMACICKSCASNPVHQKN